MTDTDTSELVVVIGAGLMGTGISHSFAAAGFSIALVDIDDAALDRAIGTISSIFADGVRLGKLAPAVAESALSRIKTQTSLEKALTDSAPVLAIETATESIEAKVSIVREADRLLPPQAIIATNTSALSVTEIAAATNRADRVLGMHFFNPVHKMRLLELVRGVTTSDETIARARAWGDALGKTTIVVNEAPGLATSRMSAMMGNEAMYMLMEGVADAEDIDTALRVGFNHPMGPLELGDLTGWDTRLAVLEYLHTTLGEKFRPCPLIRKMVKAGRLGRKTSMGVYEYLDDGRRIPGSGLKAR